MTLILYLTSRAYAPPSNLCSVNISQEAVMVNVALFVSLEAKLGINIIDQIPLVDFSKNGGIFLCNGVCLHQMKKETTS